MKTVHLMMTKKKREAGRSQEHDLTHPSHAHSTGLSLSTIPVLLKPVHYELMNGLTQSYLSKAIAWGPRLRHMI